MRQAFRSESTSAYPKRNPTFLWRLLMIFFWGVVVNTGLLGYQWMRSGFEGAVNQFAERNSVQVAHLVSCDNGLMGHWLLVIGKKIEASCERGASVISEKVTMMIPPLAKQGMGQYLEKIKKIKKALIKVIAIVKLSVVTVLLKMICLGSGLLLYLMASMLGALDGLSMRYVRTCEGGRESTFVFHRVTEGMSQLFILMILLYLVLPFQVTQSVFVITLSVILFSCFYIAASNLKKFL